MEIIILVRLVVYVYPYCFLLRFVGSGRYEQAVPCSVEEQEEGAVVEMAAVAAIPAPAAPAS
jgi:hypothetical protein